VLLSWPGLGPAQAGWDRHDVKVCRW